MTSSAKWIVQDEHLNYFFPDDQISLPMLKDSGSAENRKTSDQQLEFMIKDRAMANRADHPVLPALHKTIFLSAELPDDIRRVAELAANTICKGFEQPVSALDLSGLPGAVPVGWFDCRGFRVSAIEVVEYFDQIEDGQSKARLKLVLTFEDDLSRRAFFTADVGYEPGLDMHDNIVAAVQEVDPVFPVMQAYIVQHNEMVQAFSKNNSFSDFYLEVLSRAESLVPADEHRREKLNIDRMSLVERLTEIPEELVSQYWVVVFLMDRSSDNAVFKVDASGSRDGQSWTDEVFYEDFQGWRAGYFKMTFALDWEPSFARVYYLSADNDRIQDNPVLAGLFSIERDYSDWPVFDMDTASQGPLARLGFVLDPQDEHDFLIIQNRLKELGILSRVSKAWDGEAQRALKMFQSSRGLSPTGVWDQQTQKKMFWNTGL